MDWEKVDVGDDTIGSFVFLSSSASKIKDDDRITNPSHSLVKIGNSSHTLIITDYQTSILSNHDHYMEPESTDYQTSILSNPNHNLDPLKTNPNQNIDPLKPNSNIQPPEETNLPTHDKLINSLNPHDILTNSLNPPDILTNSLYPPDVLTNSLYPPDILTNSLKPHDQIYKMIDPTLTNSQKHHTLVNSPQSEVHGEGPKNKIINTDGPKDSHIYSKFIKDVFKDQPITVDTPISVLEGIDDSVAEILETQASVRGLGALVSLPVDIYNFIKEAGLVADLERLVQNASALLVEAERIVPTTETQDDESIKLLQESTVDPFPIENNSLNDKVSEPLDIESLPITILKGINNDGMALSLEKHAFIFTVGELAAFPTNWPGIYHMIKESDMLPELDVYIDIAKKWIKTGREPNLEIETIHKN